MPRFIVVHTAPLTEELLKKIATELPPHEVLEDVSWNLTYCDFDDNKFFCEWEGPSKEVVELGIKAANIPFDAIYPVRIFYPAKAELEP
jgi:hypothetical protein